MFKCHIQALICNELHVYQYTQTTQLKNINLPNIKIQTNSEKRLLQIDEIFNNESPQNSKLTPGKVLEMMLNILLDNTS